MSNVNVNNRTSVHAGSGGTVTSPDVCKTPRRCRPQVYSNVSKSSDAAKTAGSVNVSGNPGCNKDSIFSVSSGDEPGTCGGSSSGTIKQKAEFITFSPNVSLEGKPAVRNGDLMTSNNRNTPPMPLIQSGASDAPKLKPAEVNGLDENKYPNKLVPVLIGNARPIGLNGVVSAFGKNDYSCYKINIGSADKLGKEATGQTRWGLTQLNVPEQQYDTYLSLVDNGKTYTKEQIDFFKKNKYPNDLDVYHIPLTSLASVEREQEITYSDVELIPVYPARLINHDKDLCAPVRDGWLYFYINGHLWREIKVNGSKNEFSDVNITRYQGFNSRPAKVQSQDNVILLPRALGDVVDIQFAYSEQQWSWAYIERMGGMSSKDSRYIPNLEIYAQRNKSNQTASVDYAAQKVRLQKSKLTSYTPIKKSSHYARTRYLIPIQTAMEENIRYTKREKLQGFQFQNLSQSDLNTELPMLVIYDAVGEARSLACEYHNALMIFQLIMKDLSGTVSTAEMSAMNSIQKRHNEIQSVKYKMACVLHQYLYIGTEQVAPDSMSNDERDDFNDSLKDRKQARNNYLDETDYFKFTKRKEREEQHKKINKLRNKLIDFLEDDESRYNFSVAMYDQFAMEGEEYYLPAMRCISEVFKDILKSSELLDAHLSNKKFDQLEFLQSDKGVNLMLSILNMGTKKHRLHDCMFAIDTSSSVEQSSLREYQEVEPKPASPQFNTKKLAQIEERLQIQTNGDQQQVYRRFGEALGGWTELHANFAFSFHSAQRIIYDAQKKANAQGEIIKDFKVASKMKAKYSKLYININQWRIILNHLMRVYSISNILPIDTVRLPVENVVRGPYPKGYMPLDIETKKAHAALRLSEIEKGLHGNALKLEVNNQFGKSMGLHDLKSILNLDASLATAYTLSESQISTATAVNKNYVEVYLFRQGIKTDNPLTQNEVDNLLKEQTELLSKMKSNASDLANEIARNKLIADIKIDPKLRKEALMRSGYNTVILPIMFAVNVWNVMNYFDKVIETNKTRDDIDFKSAVLDMVAVSTEVARVVSVQIHGNPSRAQFILAQKHGMNTLFKTGASLNMRLLISAGVMGFAASTVTAGISLYDMCAAFSVGDSGAALGHGFVVTGSGLAAVAGLMMLPWMSGTLLGLGATGIGLIAVAIILIGVGIIWLFRDKPIETWLKNCAWGKTHNTIKYNYNQKTKKYKRISTPVTQQRYGGQSNFVYHANKNPLFDLIIPDNEYNAWKSKPELALQRLMDIINRPHIQFKDRKPSSDTIILQIICPGFILGQSEQTLKLEYAAENISGELSLASNNKNQIQVNRGILTGEFWTEVDIHLWVNPLNKNQIDAMELHISRDIFIKNLPDEKNMVLAAKLKHWPIGKNKTLSPSISNLYSLPDPERDDDGNIKYISEEFLKCETEVQLRFNIPDINGKAL